MEGVLSKGVLSGNGLCLEGVMYGGGFVRGGFVRAPSGTDHFISPFCTNKYIENFCSLDKKCIYVPVYG